MHDMIKKKRNNCKRKINDLQKYDNEAVRTSHGLCDLWVQTYGHEVGKNWIKGSVRSIKCAWGRHCWGSIWKIWLIIYFWGSYGNTDVCRFHSWSDNNSWTSREAITKLKNLEQEQGSIQVWLQNFDGCNYYRQNEKNLFDEK